jgi:hypothetical protein
MLRVQRERMVGRYDRQRLLRVPGGLDWQEHGLQPRWLGMETSDCVVALEPSIFHGHGAHELDRFLAGARMRDELALVVAVIGDIDDDRARSVLSYFDSSIHLGKLPASCRPSIPARPCGPSRWAANCRHPPPGRPAVSPRTSAGLRRSDPPASGTRQEPSSHGPRHARASIPAAQALWLSHRVRRQGPFPGRSPCTASAPALPRSDPDRPPAAPQLALPLRARRRRARPGRCWRSRCGCGPAVPSRLELRPGLSGVRGAPRVPPRHNAGSSPGPAALPRGLVRPASLPPVPPGGGAPGRCRLPGTGKRRRPLAFSTGRGADRAGSSSGGSCRTPSPSTCRARSSIAGSSITISGTSSSSLLIPRIAGSSASAGPTQGRS